MKKNQPKIDEILSISYNKKKANLAKMFHVEDVLSAKENLSGDMEKFSLKVSSFKSFRILVQVDKFKTTRQIEIENVR